MADTAVEHGAEAGGAGMPQLNPDYFANQIVWLLITLVVIYFILSRIALPRIASILAERQGTITNDIAAAEELKTRAQEAEAAYDKALSDARAEAAKIVDDTKDTAKEIIAAMGGKADARTITAAVTARMKG